MTPAERIALALRLGDEDVALLCAAQGLARAEAVRRIAASRRVGRLPSAAARGES